MAESKTQHIAAPEPEAAEDFDELLKKIQADPDAVDSLTEEQVIGLRRKINPYGRTIQGADKFTCVSIVNMAEAYMRRELMTSLIGFMYRRADEYELAPGDPPCPLDDYAAFMGACNESCAAAKDAHAWLDEHPSDAPPPESGAAAIEEAAIRRRHNATIERAAGFKKRLIIRQFLDDNFQFNPDKHVRSAYARNTGDPERPPLPGVSPAAAPQPAQAEVAPALSAPAAAFARHIPPADIFHRWQYYQDSQYEAIREAVGAIYAEKPDIEFAVNTYDQFDTAMAAADFVQKHRDEVITDILTLQNGKWNLIGPFKENRERINFYNSKTAVLEGYFQQMELDKKLGADLMRKRVERLKAKNVKVDGPDHKAVVEARKLHPSGAEQLGAERALLEGKITKETQTFHIHEECPYDAVQVDVFNFTGGGQGVKKTEFFSQAEAPKQATPGPPS